MNKILLIIIFAFSTAFVEAQKAKTPPIKVKADDFYKMNKLCELIKEIDCNCLIESYNVSVAVKGKALTFEVKGAKIPDRNTMQPKKGEKYFFENFISNCKLKKYVILF